MKRTPCFRAIAPSSCGSMMTKRDLSYAKCRSIRGSVPLPIEPKPIITMGPEIFAWICEDGLISGLRKIVSVVNVGSGGAALCGHFDLDLHLGSCETNDDQQRRRGTNVAQDFATDGEVGIHVLGVGDVVGRADDIGHREAALFQGSLDGPEAVP